MILKIICVRIETVMKMDEKVYIYTDGACSGNPGPGGWASILVWNGREKAICGGDCSTTNNRMEITAVIEALKALKWPCDVVITTDSKYVSDAVNKGWLESWKKHGWKKADRSPVLNVEYWMELDGLLGVHNVEFIWIKGHAGHEYNERCDKMAVGQAVIFSK